MVEGQLPNRAGPPRGVHLKGMWGMWGAVRADRAPQHGLLEGPHDDGRVLPIGGLHKGGPVRGAEPRAHVQTAGREVGALMSALHTAAWHAAMASDRLGELEGECNLPLVGVGVILAVVFLSQLFLFLSLAQLGCDALARRFLEAGLVAGAELVVSEAARIREARASARGRGQG